MSASLASRCDAPVRCATCGREAQRRARQQRFCSDRCRDQALAYVTDGREAIGFVCSRGKLGFEAFDTEERSLGLFETAAKAANAVFDAATNEEAGVATRSAP